MEQATLDPEVVRHVRARKVELGRALLGRRKVYLDTRFWIILRDADSARRTDVGARKLLHHLRRGVRRGRLVCPISTDLLMELCKQQDPATRHATAALADELGLGVSAMEPHALLATEIHRFISATLHGEVAVDEMQELIWTKAAFALGDYHPVFEGIPPGDLAAMQTAAYDRLWNVPLESLVADVDDVRELRDDLERLTRDTNAQNAEHKEELRSFEQTYDNELRGIVEHAGEVAAEIFEHLEQRRETAPAIMAADRPMRVNLCRNLILEALRRPENRSALRTLHVKASIHAAMRWDKDRKFKVNDWHDFGHATIALTYCDAFLAERSMHHLVTMKSVDLERVNGCVVASRIDDAVAVVRGL